MKKDIVSKCNEKRFWFKQMLILQIPLRTNVIKNKCHLEEMSFRANIIQNKGHFEQMSLRTNVIKNKCH